MFVFQTSPSLCMLTRWSDWLLQSGLFFSLLIQHEKHVYFCCFCIRLTEKGCRGNCLSHVCSSTAHSISTQALLSSGQHNDARMNLAIGLTAARYGAVVANYTEVVHLLKSSDPQTGKEKVCGAHCRDIITGE